MIQYKQNNGAASRKSFLSWQNVGRNFDILLAPFVFLLFLSYIIPVLPCMSRKFDDKNAQFQYKNPEYIAFGKGDLQLQATNLAEGQNAQPVLSGDRPGQSVLQRNKSYFVAQASRNCFCWSLRGGQINMLVNPHLQEGAEKDWYV